MSLADQSELAELLDEGERREGENAGAARARELEALAFGIHDNVPDAVYHARVKGIASKSVLDLVRRSPARYKAWLEGAERNSTPALHLGKAAHMAQLEPAPFERRYVIAPDFGDLRATPGRTTKEQGKANKQARAAWIAEHAGAMVLDCKDGATTLGMVRAIAAHPTASAMLLDGRPEVTLKWRDAATGLICKARPDYWLADLAIAIDMKSTTDARAPAFSRTIEDYGYHRQEAFYREGFAALGQPLDHFLFLPVEKESPFDLAAWELDAEDVAAGAAEVLEDLYSLADCMQRDEWPGYPLGVRRIRRPGWARKKV